MKILPEMHQGPIKEVTIKPTFLNSSVECRPPPSTSNGAPNQTITSDRFSMKILLEIYLAIRKSPLGYTLKTIRRAQTSANVQEYNNSLNILITTDCIFVKFLSDRSRAKKSPHNILEVIHGAHTSAKHQQWCTNNY